MAIALGILFLFVFFMDFLLVLALYCVKRLFVKSASEKKQMDEISKKGEQSNEWNE